VALLCAASLAWAGELTPKEVTAGRKVYVAKCAKCHQFHDPKNYGEVDWVRWLDAMSRKAKLKPEQDELLRRYLDEYRAGRIPKAK
jgi:cytochrome c553